MHFLQMIFLLHPPIAFLTTDVSYGSRPCENAKAINRDRTVTRSRPFHVPTSQPHSILKSKSRISFSSRFELLSFHTAWVNRYRSFAAELGARSALARLRPISAVQPKIVKCQKQTLSRAGIAKEKAVMLHQTARTQLNSKSGAVRPHRGRRNLTVMTLDDLPANCQTQPNPVRLRRHECLEYIS